MFDFVPGTFWVRRVLDVEQCVIDPRERLSCILIVAAGSKYNMPKIKTWKKYNEIYIGEQIQILLMEQGSVKG